MGKNNGEWYELANWNCLIVINTHQFTPNWTTHIKSKNIRWEQLQSVYTETRINSLKAWLPSHSPASPNFPPLWCRWHEVSEQTCHPAEHNWVCNLWPCSGRESLALCLFLSRRDTRGYTAAGSELDWIKICSQMHTRREARATNSNCTVMPGVSGKNMTNQLDVVSRVMPVLTTGQEQAWRIMIKLRALSLPDRRETPSPTDFVHSTCLPHIATFIHFLIPKQENWHRPWPHEESFQGIKNKHQMLRGEINVKHIDSMLH